MNCMPLLQGILKKPRSYSESEGNLSTLEKEKADGETASVVRRRTITLSYEATSCSSSSGMSRSPEECACSLVSVDPHSSNASISSTSSTKKCVHFNKQVVKNVFKTGSTVCGMRKPNSNKNNKKKNKRKRTTSDPSDTSHDQGKKSITIF